VFTGNYERTLDGKGRLVLPPKHRSKLPEGGFLVPLGGCLRLYPADEFQDLLDRMTVQARNGEVREAAVLAISSSAEEVEPDAQGRISLPPRLRTKAELTNNEVVVVGNVRHVQIWSAEKWAAQAPDLEQQAEEAAQSGKTI
jgi:MraZ protein